MALANNALAAGDPVTGVVVVVGPVLVGLVLAGFVLAGFALLEAPLVLLADAFDPVEAEAGKAWTRAKALTAPVMMATARRARSMPHYRR
jgi:hypothetical protein